MTEARQKTLQEEMLALFSEDFSDTKKAHEIYEALCNNIWEKNERQLNFSWRAAGEFVATIRNEIGLESEDPEVCQRCKKKRDEHVFLAQENFLTLMLREEGKDDEADKMRLTFPFCQEEERDLFLAGFSGSEDYMDYYCSGGEGRVAPWVEERFTEHGWVKKDYPEVKQSE